MLEPARAPLLPPLALAVYIACVAGAGALANCAVIAALFRRYNIGLFSIIIQLSLADILVIATTCGPEPWSYNVGTWEIGNNGCKLYRGLNVFATTASLYLVITVSLHTLATVNLFNRISVRKELKNEEEEIRCSRHSLVASSDSSTPPRTMDVDYRMPVTQIPVTTPTVFVWVLSASLSVPQFVLASTVQRENSTSVYCALLDTAHSVNMHMLMAVFDVIVPFIVMGLVFVAIVFKLKSSSAFTHHGSAEYVAALKLCLWLILVNVIMCAPRAVDTAYRTFNSHFSERKFPLKAQDESDVIKLAFSAIHLASTLVRPILCILIIPQLKRKFSYGQ